MEKFRQHRNGVSTLALVFTGLALIGLVVGPGQFFYCIFFSGKHVASYPVSMGQPIEIKLDPSMNPARVNATFQYKHHPTARRSVSSFNCQLVDESTAEVWNQKFEITDKKDDTKRKRNTINLGSGAGTQHTTVKTFSIEAAGDYQAIVTKNSDQRIKVNSIELSLRRNVRPVHLASAIGGLVGMIIGIVGLVVCLKPKLSIATDDDDWD